MADFESSEKATKEDYQEHAPPSPLEHQAAVSSPPSRRKIVFQYFKSLFLCFPRKNVLIPQDRLGEQNESKNKEKIVRRRTIQPSEIRDGHKPHEPSKIYKPLPYDNSIRLLRIEPGETDQDLMLTLEHARLDNTLPSYEALSYVWGVKANKKVICNGEEMRDITDNLFDAIKRLRFKDKSRLVWCDALCIDQQNPIEKGLQVRKMHHIYARAEKVLIILDMDENGDAEGAFGTLCSLVNSKTHIQQQKLKLENRLATYESIDSAHKVHIPLTAPDPGDSIWIKVMVFFCNTWFLRMWVLQEIVLARKAIVIWGSCSLSWDIVGRAIDYIRENMHLHNMLESRSLQNAFFMWQMCNIRRQGVGERNEVFSFLQLLDIARSFDVTEAKDKVYGLLGFPTRDANRETGVFVRPSYTQSLADVYTDIARKLLAKEGNLDFLSFVVHKGWRENVDERNKDGVERDTGEEHLPSWVPNWNTKDTIYPFVGFGPGNAHKAGLGRPLILPTSSSAISNTLTLNGKTITTIRNVGTATPFEQLHKSAPAFKSLISWYLSTAPSISAEILAKTLGAHRNVNGMLITDDEKNLANFMALLEALGFDLATTWPGGTTTGDTTTKTRNALADLAARKGDPDTARETLWRYLCYRAPFVTESGEVGLGPGATRKGDVVVVLWGGQVPFVLRRYDEGEGWMFIGECYVDKYMTGIVGEGLGEEVFEMR